MFKKIFLSIMFCCVALSASAVELDSLGRDPNYVKSILKRSEKIVDNLGITDPAVKQNVLYILANRYFKLNDIYEVRDQKVKYAKAVLTGASKQAAIEAAELEKDATLYRCHFEFPASLSLYINDKQIDAIKDGMTYNSLQVQYESLVDMVPSLTEEEKKQIYAWYKEAREFSMDAENSDKKHAAFNKYKGRINNYLTQRGYDLVKERNEWYKRLKAAGKKI